MGFLKLNLDIDYKINKEADVHVSDNLLANSYSLHLTAFYQGWQKFVIWFTMQNKVLESYQLWRAKYNINRFKLNFEVIKTIDEVVDHSIVYWNYDLRANLKFLKNLQRLCTAQLLMIWKILLVQEVQLLKLFTFWRLLLLKYMYVLFTRLMFQVFIIIGQLYLFNATPIN